MQKYWHHKPYALEHSAVSLYIDTSIPLSNFTAVGYQVIRLKLD